MRTEIWEPSPQLYLKTAWQWTLGQASSYRQHDKREDKLNHFPLRSKLQSKWPAREAKLWIEHLVQMMEPALITAAVRRQ